MRSMAWTKRRLRRLKTLWAQGKTAGEIAARLRVSRAAVLGKVFRLRLGRAEAAKPAPARDNAASPGPRRPGRRHAERQIQAAGAKKSPGKTLLELTNHTCHWPIGEPGRAGFHFCGEAGADLDNGRPYCERHARRAYIKPPKGAHRTSRGVATVKSPSLVPAPQWRDIIANVLRRRA